MDTTVGTTGTHDAVVISTGVLVALNQTATVAGQGLAVSGYALPINRALAVARQIDGRAGA